MLLAKIHVIVYDRCLKNVLFRSNVGLLDYLQVFALRIAVSPSVNDSVSLPICLA